MKTAGLSQNVILKIIGLNPGTYHKRRHRKPATTPAIPQSQRANPQRLTPAEMAVVKRQLRPVQRGRKTILQCWADAEDCDHGPGALASLRTYYRYAKKWFTKSSMPRRKNAKKAVHQIVATRPNAVWAWDITALPGLFVGQIFYAYVVMDVFSRKVVAVAVHSKQCERRAVELFDQAIAAFGAPAVVHADNGATMKSGLLRDVLHGHGVTLTFGRPRTSNDNAVIESWFGTYKQHGGTPKEYSDLAAASCHITGFVRSYNAVHVHRGVGFHTPDSVFDGSWRVRQARREQRRAQRALKHPYRYGRGVVPAWKIKPGRVVASRVVAPPVAQVGSDAG